MGLFIEGLDVPAVSCCILARPTKSITIYLQAVGRVMRPHETKTDCIILDHAGLTYAHGFVDMPRIWTLDGKPKKKKDDALVIGVHVCEGCFCAYSKAEYPNACPECGFITKRPEPPQVRAEGELVELNADTMALYKAKRQQQQREERKAARTLEQLIELGKQRGYKEGWAHKIHTERKQWVVNRHG